MPEPAMASPGQPQQAAAATFLERIRSSRTTAATTVTLSGNGRLTPASVSETTTQPRRLLLEFPNLTSKAPGQTTVDSALVKKVSVDTSGTSPVVTKVSMDVVAGTTYHVEQAGPGGRDLSVVFEPAQSSASVLLAPDVTPDVPAEPEPAITLQQAIANAAPIAPTDTDPIAALRPAPPAAAAARTAPVARTPRPSLTPPPPSLSPAPPPIPMARAAAQQAPVTMSPPPQTAPPPGQVTGNERKYTGAPISLDFNGLDLRSLLRVFADPSGLNIVIDPAVPSTPVDILLKDLPWDQALEVILKTHQLGFEAEGTVIRIAPLKVLEDEQRQQSTLAAAKALAGDLLVQTFSLSYAKAAEMMPLLTKSALSSRGQIQVDTRTNVIIMTDLPDRIQTAANLIGALDRPEPQVEVEARIVQTTRDFAKAIGVQWGLNGRVNPAIGNTTNLAFPNSGSLGGRTGQTNLPQDTSRATGTDNTATAVNLPVSGATSAIGLALGAVNGALNIDVALSALERSGKGRVLSTPRLTTQNNVEAEVAQGVQVPIQTVSNNTVTVTFKDAVLTLKVTPQITSANTVIMKITLENATPDFSRSVNGIPPIDTQRASTQVQVNDGATTIIGGIFVSQEQLLKEGTPLLQRLPLLGWLFRRDSTDESSRELLIFITPRIMRG
jgi:type IV pilus assembly protein PilQ